MQVLNIFHVLIAIALIAFVLVQRGQGATAGAAFGSGASGTVFGARGAGNFLSRSTWVLAALFCTISLTMGVMVSHMMEQAEPDLGVVSTVEPAAPAGELQAPPEQSASVGEPVPADIPAFEQPSQNVAPVGERAEPAVDSEQGGSLPAASSDGSESKNDSGNPEPPADNS